MLSAREQELFDFLRKYTNLHDVELVCVELIGSQKSPTIRVYIDADNGVSFDCLAAAQSWIGALLEKLDPFPGAYVLEVSSPGIDRPLCIPEQFVRACGETIRVKTHESVNGSMNFTGQLASTDDDGIQLDVSGECISIPYTNIKRAHVKGTVQFS